MRLKLIGCNVLFREICLCAARSKNVVDLEFLEKGLHDYPDRLRAAVQEKIDETDEARYEAIVLAYALCSNGLAGIRSRGIPVVLPRAHDCITLFLGSKESYKQHHNDAPGTYYYTSGWIERGNGTFETKPHDPSGINAKYEAYVRKYGEDNARYLMQFERSWIENYSRAAFINVGIVDFPQYEEYVKKIAEQNGWDYVRLRGDKRLIKKLIDGEWNEDEFLIIQPEKEVAPSYDDAVVKARSPE